MECCSLLIMVGKRDYNVQIILRLYLQLIDNTPPNELSVLLPDTSTPNVVVLLTVWRMYVSS